MAYIIFGLRTLHYLPLFNIPRWAVVVAQLVEKTKIKKKRLGIKKKHSVFPSRDFTAWFGFEKCHFLMILEQVVVHFGDNRQIFCFYFQHFQDKNIAFRIFDQVILYRSRETERERQWPWSSLAEVDEGCSSPSGKLLCF